MIKLYRVLYRKWRPATFDEVSGQEHITSTLKSEVSSGRLSHAYLFTGSRGTGKTSCAKILAKAVNCLEPHGGNPCGRCEICRGIDDGSMIDVIEMDAASNRKIDDIRQIIDEAQFKPAKCAYRVYIIDEVHMLTTEAFNALLKTLEEPPGHVIFILATTEVYKLPQTILSRCQRFDFHRIPPDDIADRVMFVADRENVKITREAALLTAAVADGALRDALSLLDSCIAISSDIDEETVRSAAGLVRKDYLFELCACVINKNAAGSLNIIDRLYRESKDMARLCDELLSHFRALMLIKSIGKAKDMLVMSEDEFDKAVTQADYLSLSDIIHYMDILSAAYQRMGKGTGDRTEMETALVKLSSPETDSTPEALASRVAALERAVSSGAVPRGGGIQTDPTEPFEAHELIAEDEEKPNKVPETKPAPSASAAERQPVNVDEVYANAKPFPSWTETVKELRSVSMSTAAAFSGSKAYESGDYLLIDTENDMAFKLLKQSSRREDIRRVLLRTTGKVYKLGPYKRARQEEEKKDPLELLRESLEDSGAEITEN